MSPREQPERVQAAIRSDRDPLASTVARLEATLRGRVGRYLLLGALLGTGGFTAHKSGFADILLARAPEAPRQDLQAATDPRVDVLAKRTANTERLVRWLVRQEIRRQAREGGAVSEPPEDVE
jgi:hypothetical protein